MISYHSSKLFVNGGKYNFKEINSNENYVLCYCFVIIIVICAPSSYIQISAEQQWWNISQVVVNQCNFIAFIWTVLHTRKNISNTYLWVSFFIKKTIVSAVRKCFHEFAYEVFFTEFCTVEKSARYPVFWKSSWLFNW